MNCCRLHCVTDAYSAMLKTVSGNSFLGSTGHRPAAVELGKTRRTQRRVLPLLPRREERGGERRCIFARVSRPGPLPEGEGTPHPARRRVEALSIGESAAYDSPNSTPFGHWPVPPGDSPGGTGSASGGNKDEAFEGRRFDLPVGESPTGMGESPVLPILRTGSMPEPPARSLPKFQHPKLFRRVIGLRQRRTPGQEGVSSAVAAV